MPIYEYLCQDCHLKFEIIRSIKDADAELTCMDCKGKNVKRQISLFNATSSGQPIVGSSTCSSCPGGSCSTCGSN